MTATDLADWTTQHFSYVDSVNTNLICCICQQPFLEPVTARTCAHTFCRSCITHALRTSRHCPIDRSALSSRDLIRATPVIRDIVDELIVYCSNRALGCSHKCQRSLLQGHVKDDCLFASVSCPDETCDKTVRRTEARSGACIHLRESDAPAASTSTTCPDCSVRCTSLDALKEHILHCTFRIVSCTHSSHGCPWTGASASLSNEHLNQCPYEVLRGFFALSDARTARLEEDNKALRRRLDASEGLVQVLSGEVAALKSAIGPYYPSNSPLLPPRVQEVHPPEDAPFFEQERHSPPTSPQQPFSDISSYFPPALPSSPLSSSPPPSQPTSAVLPPTPLHTHLTTLASTIDALRSAHDAFRLDTEAAHAALGGELGALRASLGGLRMFMSEFSSRLLAERAPTSGDDAPVHPIPWAGRMYAPPPYGPGYIGLGMPPIPLANPSAPVSASTMPFKL